ncbi:MAG: O-antigen ligase family protein [Sedimenticola sp.]
MIIYLPVPIVMNIYKGDYFWGNYFSFITSFVIYFAIQNNSCFYKKSYVELVVKLTRVYAVILSAEIVYKSLELYHYGMFTSKYKTELIINLGGSNTIGFYLLLLFFVIYFMQKNIYDKALLFLIFICVVLTSSRGTLLVLFIVYFSAQPIRKKMILLFSSLMLGILFLGQTIFNNTADIHPFFAGHGNDISSGRFVILSRAYDLIKNNILSGVGFGNFTVPEFQYSNIERWRPHNILLEIQLGGGLIATLLFVGVMLTLFVRFRANMKRVRLLNGIYFGVAAILLQGMFEPNIFSYRVDTYFWFFVGMAMVISREVDSRRGVIFQVAFYHSSVTPAQPRLN